MENKTALSVGVMLNAYPDSMGGTLADIVALLGRGEMKGAFDAFYILPSIFNTDLDRGFSVIDYNLNECYAGQADLDALRKLGSEVRSDSEPRLGAVAPVPGPFEKRRELPL